MTLAEDDDPWAMALPLPSAEVVVAQFVDTFHALREENPERYHFGMGEVQLTTRLGVRLENTPGIAPVGFWKYEVPTNRRDEGDPRRVDITFFTVVGDATAVTLVFECKKMRVGSGAKGDRTNYMHKGVRRFVQGSYAPREAIGFMVPFTQDTSPVVFASLKKALAIPSMDVLLGLTRYPSGDFWEQPPRRFPHAYLSTRHQRDIVEFPVTCEITLYHVPLCFPPVGT